MLEELLRTAFLLQMQNHWFGSLNPVSLKHSRPMIFVFTRSLIMSRCVLVFFDCLMQLVKLEDEPGLVGSIKKQIFESILRVTQVFCV